MTTTDLTMLGLLLIIASQTSYTSYRSWRGAKSTNNNSVFVDTSVLIDGRILPIAETGFVPGTLVIPRSVIGELQFLADNADTEKREKARRGLDVARELQDLEGLDVQLLQDGSKADEGVDERLLNLAKKHGGSICTIDFNLNKVAQVENIRVLNVNELAQQLRMAYLPGDKMLLELTQTGSDSHQAVGHLPDGTMVVVEHAKQQIGSTIEIEIIRSLQTAAGRMMFARGSDARKKPTQTQTDQKQSKKAHTQVRTAASKKPSQPRSQRRDTNSPSDEAKPTETTPQPAAATDVDDTKPAAQPNERNSRHNKSSSSQQRTKKQPSGRGRRTPSGAEREASLIELVNKQSS